MGSLVGRILQGKFRGLVYFRDSSDMGPGVELSHTSPDSEPSLDLSCLKSPGTMSST